MTISMTAGVTDSDPKQIAQTLSRGRRQLLADANYDKVIDYSHLKVNDYATMLTEMTRQGLLVYTDGDKTQCRATMLGARVYLAVLLQEIGLSPSAFRAPTVDLGKYPDRRQALRLICAGKRSPIDPEVREALLHNRLIFADRTGHLFPTNIGLVAEQIQTVAEKAVEELGAPPEAKVTVTDHLHPSDDILFHEIAKELDQAFRDVVATYPSETSVPIVPSVLRWLQGFQGDRLAIIARIFREQGKPIQGANDAPGKVTP